MIIEKRKKGEEKWEEIDLHQMIKEINDFWHHDLLKVGIDRFNNKTENLLLYVAVYISLHRKYETDTAEYRII